MQTRRGPYTLTRLIPILPSMFFAGLRPRFPGLDIRLPVRHPFVSLLGHKCNSTRTLGKVLG